MLVFTTVVLLLATFVLVARRGLAPTREVQITVNDGQQLAATTGDKLLWALAVQGIHLPAACGGRGSCGQCRVIVTAGGGEALPTEENHISRQDVAAGTRLACMVALHDDVSVSLPASMLQAREWQSRVRSNRSITTYLKELVLELPGDLDLTFAAGDYVLLRAPVQTVRYADFDIDPQYREEWQRRGLLDLVTVIDVPTTRAYSLASHPLETRSSEGGVLKLVVRIAIPPPDAPTDVPPGKVSSWVFGLAPGDSVTLSGPFGTFHVRDSDREMVLIGGGAGIAPLRAMVFEQLLVRRTQRRLSLWYGARNLRELCYAQEFEALAADHENFSYHLALSDRDVEADWPGSRGYIHHILFQQYLQHHPCPEDADYYLCGPPLMSSAVMTMLEDLGVGRDSVFYDDFGE
jgi:Na+-transporting NADH:ubiquinone oxidoreductase subunit F